MYKAGKLNLDDMVTRQRAGADQRGDKDILQGRNIRGVIRYTNDDLVIETRCPRRQSSRPRARRLAGLVAVRPGGG